MQRAIEKFKKNSSINVGQTLFYHQTDFNMKIRDKILSNFRSIEYKRKRFFLYLIVFRPENIHELNQSFFIFDRDGSSGESAEKESKFSSFKIKSYPNFDGYIEGLLKAKEEITALGPEGQHKIVCYFENIFVLAAEHLEKLIMLINEEIVEELPNFRFNFLVNIVEKYQFTFRLKDLHVERIDYVSKNSLFFKALIKMIKGSVLPSPVFSPEFLGKIHRHFKDFCITLMTESNKWSIYKELHYVENFDEIDTKLKDPTFAAKARNHNFKFMVGLKILKLIGSVLLGVRPDYLHEWMVIVISSRQSIDFNKFNSTTHESLNAFGRRIDELGSRVVQRDLDDSHNALKCFFQKINTHIKTYNEEMQSGQKVEALAITPSSKNRREVLASLILSDSNLIKSYTGTLNEIYKELNQGIKLTIRDYYDWVEKTSWEFLMSDFKHIESMVNPDILGSFYEAIRYFPSYESPLFSTKILFDILKGKQTRNNASAIFEEFSASVKLHLESLNQSLKESGVKNKTVFLKSVDLFLYNQQLFEHLKLTTLTHSNIYKLEKLFYAKYRLPHKNSVH